MADRPDDAGSKIEGAEMTDDLVKRLREVGGMSDDGATRWYINPDGPEAADRIEKLEAALDEAAFSQTLFDAVVGQRNKATDRIEKLESVTKDDAKWLAAYHKWCEMNGCAPPSSDLISARKALEENK